MTEGKQFHFYWELSTEDWNTKDGQRRESPLAPSLKESIACGHDCRYVDRKGSAAILTSIQSAGVALEVNLRNNAQARKHASET